MAADGVPELTLNYTLEFKPVNGNRSVSAATSVRSTKTIKVTCSDAGGKLLDSDTAYMMSKSLKAMFSLNSRQNASIKSLVMPGKNGTFDVAYRLEENAGIWGAKFAVDYDSTRVQLNGYTLGDIFTLDEVIPPESYENGRYVFFARRNTFVDTTKTGDLVTLHFEILDGVSISDYPVNTDTDASQFVNSGRSIVNLEVNSNAPRIRVDGNTSTICKQDTITVFADAGSSIINSVQVKNDKGSFTDITESYTQGYTVNENGKYTFKLTTTNGEEATTSITYTLIDTVKPVVVIDAEGYEENKWATGSITLTPRNTADNLGTTSFSYRIGEEGEWNSYLEPITVHTNNGILDTTYYFKAISESGVQSDVAEYKVKLDNTVPAISGVTDGKIYCKSVTVAVTDDNLDTVKLDGKAVELEEGSFTVYPEDKVQTITAADKAGNEKSVSITVIRDHMWDKGVVTLEPTVSEKCIRTYTCTNCGETRTEDIQRILPEIIEGQNNRWNKASGGGLTFHSNAALADFVSVLVDSNTVDAENYDLREGSTIVTLKPEYLATLPTGKHTLNINFTTGMASAEFTIEAVEPAKTGDKISVGLWIVLMFVSLSTFAAFRISKKRRKSM